MKKLTGWTNKPVTYGHVALSALVNAVLGLVGLAFVFRVPAKIKAGFMKLKGKIFG